MVRLKQRYLLLNILYPTDASQNTAGSDRSSALAPTSTSALPSLAFQAPTPDYVTAGAFVSHLRNHIALLFGDFGLGVSVSSLKVVYFSNATSTIILRVPRNHHRLVWAALSHVTELPASKRGTTGRRCVVRVVRVSGTIRKAEEELIRRAKRDVVRARLSQGGQGEAARAVPSIGDSTNVEAIDDLSGVEEYSD